MKKLFRKIAEYVVAAYAKRMYRKAVDIAEKRHKDEKTMIYVLSSPFDDSQLVTCSKKEFRAMKEKLKIRHQHGVEHLKKGCWYHTADAIERNGMAPIDLKARRIAFIRMMLKRAGYR